MWFSYTTLSLVVCFFFKQKTADEVRIGDWSSDVCSSDLTPSSSPARATVILKVEPGAYSPPIALLSIGRSGSATRAFHACAESPPTKALGSKLGVEASARMSPL